MAHICTDNQVVRRLMPCEYICSSNKTLELLASAASDNHSKKRSFVTAPQSNRIIYLCNPDIIDMQISHQEFGPYIAAADAVLVSGFNAMQNQALLLDRRALERTLMSPIETVCARVFARARRAIVTVTTTVGRNTRPFCSCLALSKQSSLQPTWRQLQLVVSLVAVTVAPVWFQYQPVLNLKIQQRLVSAMRLSVDSSWRSSRIDKWQFLRRVASGPSYCSCTLCNRNIKRLLLAQ